jgi:hypothetical protein
MNVNIVRSKFLINSTRAFGEKKKSSPVERCNHCGGAFRNSGEFTTCIMCSREKEHVCSNCAHAGGIVSNLAG